MSIRVARAEVRFPAHSRKEMQDRWHEASQTCQHITNFLWQHWLVWHVQNDSAAKIRSYLDALATWRESKQGDKPKCTVLAVPKEMGVYKALTKQFPHINVRSLSLLQQAIEQKIKQRKAATGKLSGWMAILLAHESLPSTTRKQPVPFDKANCKLDFHESERTKFRLLVRIDRFMATAKKGGEKAASHHDEVELYVGGRRGQSQRVILGRIADGTYKFAGSSLYYDQGDRKWYALLCYDKGEEPKLSGEGTAILRAGRNVPWMMRFAKGSRKRGGEGLDVAAVRKQLLTQRWSRQENYRRAGSANKGHGRERALAPLFKLSRRWKDYVQTRNHTTARQIVDECLRIGIGRLVYVQPTGSKRDSRLLAKAGKPEGRRDSTGWDWHQMATFLAYKCKEAGIHMETRQGKDRKRGDDEQSQGSNRLPVVPAPNGNGRKKRSRKQAAVV